MSKSDGKIGPSAVCLFLSLALFRFSETGKRCAFFVSSALKLCALFYLAISKVLKKDCSGHDLTLRHCY